jgi:hypothetical protein
MQTIFYIVFATILNLHTNEDFKLPQRLAKQRRVHLLCRDDNEKAKTFEDPDCLSTLKTDGIDLVNHGLTLLNSSIKISGRFYEALEDLYSTDIDTVLATVTDTLVRVDEHSASDFKFYKDDNLDKSAIYVYTDYVYSDVTDVARKR